MSERAADGRRRTVDGGRFLLLIAVCVWLMLAACAPVEGDVPLIGEPVALVETATPEASPTPVAVQFVIIGKARGGYWETVERGAQSAAQQLGLPAGSVLYYAPEQEDAAAQILAVERFVAQKVRGIALAPSDPRALVLAIRQAHDAGVWLITFDTDAPDSQRLFFTGTPQRTMGREAGAALVKLLGEKGGKAALGSTLLDDAARERITGFKEALGVGAANARWMVLDATNDRNDANFAAQVARNTLSANKDLTGAFGIYGYNGVAWCHAVREIQAAARTTVVGFEASAEHVMCLKSGALDVLVAPRPYEQGQQSVLALDSLTRKGLIETAGELRFDMRGPAAGWVVDVGVDVITLHGDAGISLAGYAAKLDEEHTPRDWEP